MSEVTRSYGCEPSPSDAPFLSPGQPLTVAGVTPPPGASAQAGTAGSSVSVPGYEVMGELGRGSMGVVYKARQVSLNRIVALKMVLVPEYAEAGQVARFRAEAEAIARLQHPNIVQVFEVGEHQGIPFFSLEFCPEGSLEKKLRGTPIDAREAARLVETLARAIQAAHRANVVHRDLKPANVLLVPDPGGAALPPEPGSPMPTRVAPKVSDFGLAKKLDQSGQTQTGVILGTPSYMAPEQAQGSKDVGVAADVYALGAILYECLTGRPPFLAATTYDTLLQVVSQEPVAPRRLNSRVPRDLETICLKCLDKAPERRYARAELMAEDVDRFLAGQPVRARPLGRAAWVGRWCRRNPVVAGLMASLGVAVVLALAALGWGYGKAIEGKAAAEAEQRETAKQRDRAEQRLYPGQLAMARMAWREGDGELARELLGATDPRHRGPEFPLLLQAYEGSRLTLRTAGARTTVAFSSDGRLLAAGNDVTVQVWDAASGRPLAALKTTGRPSFGPDNTLAVASGKTVTLYDWPSGRTLLEVVPPSPGAVIQVGFRAAGKELYAITMVPGKLQTPDGIVSDEPVVAFTAWDVSTGKQLSHVPLSQKGWFGRSGAEGADAWVFALDEKAQTGDLFEAHTGRRVRSLQDAPPYDRVAWSPDGNVVALGREGMIECRDVRTGKKALALTRQRGRFEALAFSPDGGRLLAGAEDGTIALLSASFGAFQQNSYVKHYFRGHTGQIRHLAWSPDGTSFASSVEDGTVKVWDATHGSVPRLVNGHDGGGWQYNRVLSPDGLHLAGFRRHWDNQGKRSAWCRKMVTELVLWNVRTGGQRVLATGADGAASWSDDGRMIVVKLEVPGGEKEKIALWDLHARTWKSEWLVDRSGLAWGVRSRADLIAVSNAANEIILRQLGTGREIRRWAVGADVRQLAFSEDGERLATTSEDDLIRLWDVRSGDELRRWSVAPEKPNAVAFSPDGTGLAAGGRDGRLWLWDVDSGKVRFNTRGGPDEITSLAFTPDGSRLVTNAGRVYEAETGLELARFDGLPGKLDGMGFTQDGRLYAFASEESSGTSALWLPDRATREAARTDVKSVTAPADLGRALERQKKGAQAELAFRQAIETEPADTLALVGLGRALEMQQKWAEAVSVYSKFVEVEPGNVTANEGVARALERQHKWAEAERAYRKAADLEPRSADARYGLGTALWHQGKWADAERAYRGAIEAGDGDPSTAATVSLLRRMPALHPKLPAYLQGVAHPSDNQERLALAALCRFERHFAAAVRFSAAAFDADGKMADDLDVGHRFGAACVAALSGTGAGGDVATLDGREKARLRGQSLAWLRADLGLWSERHDSGSVTTRAIVRDKMGEWQKEPDLAGVRDERALATLPEDEREAWRSLWAGVAALAARPIAE